MFSTPKVRLCRSYITNLKEKGKNRVFSTLKTTTKKQNIMWLYHEKVCQCRARMDGELFCTSESPPTLSSSAVKTKWKCSPDRQGLCGHTHTHTCTRFILLILHHCGSCAPCRGSAWVPEKHLFVLLVSQSCFIFLISRSGCFCQTSLHSAVMGEILIVQ